MTELSLSGIQPEESFDQDRMAKVERQAAVERHSGKSRTRRLGEQFLEGVATGAGETVGKVMAGLVALGVVVLVGHIASLF